MFSSTVRSSYNENLCDMYPMLRRISSGWVPTSKPLTWAVPEVGVTSPHSIRMAVDFPAPLGPRNPRISPFRTCIETWSTATKEPKRFTRFSISTAQTSPFMRPPPLRGCS